VSASRSLFLSLPNSDMFVELIKPLSRGEFIEKYWQKQPCYIRGSGDKFADLFSWNDLNRILEDYHYEYPRFRMSKFGVDLPAREYLETLPFTQVNRVNPHGLYKHFATGATLILQHADEFCPRLRELSEALQSGLGWYAEIEVIAGCGTSNGLPVHFDGSDCLALQISGEKKWRFYEPTRKAPLRKAKVFPRRYDVSPAPPPAVHLPVLTYEMKPGDFMYVPRGWWHIVEPEPGPCLSINPTVYSPTVQDFLQWLVQEMSADLLCRQHIPANAKDQHELVRDLSKTLTAHLTPKRIEDYRTYLLGEMEIPLRINLPEDASTNKKLLPDSRVRLTERRSIYVTHDGNSSQVRVRWRGNDLHFHHDHYELLLKVSDGEYHSLSSLLLSCRSPEEEAKRLGFVQELINKRILIAK
jgi:ribosomal protein L16 Arg81 hydroxylase